MAAGDLTLLQLRTRARERADQVNSQFVTDAELTGYVNSSLFELHDLLVQKYGDNYYVATPQAITTTTAQQYALASDFFKLLGVDVRDGSEWVTMRPFMFGERNKYNSINTTPRYGRSHLRYRINGDNLMLMPTPEAGLSLQVWYIPRMVELVADGDIAKGVSGWLEYVIVDAAIKMMQKEESDVSVLMAQKQMLIQRIESAAASRDAGAPPRVVDVYEADYEAEW